jgi:hypothetical protein
MGRYEPFFRIGPRRLTRIGDTLSGLELGNVCPHRFHRARSLHPKDPRQSGQGVETCPVIDVDKIKTDSCVTEPHLIGAGLTDGYVLPLHFVGSTRSVDADNFRHDRQPPWG